MILKAKLVSIVLLTTLVVEFSISTNLNRYSKTLTKRQLDNYCSLDKLFESLAHYFPDDYEQSKLLKIKKGVNHLNETAAIIRRLGEYGQNVSTKFKPTARRLKPRITESFTKINLPANCLTDIMKIIEALHNGQIWAAKFLDSMGGIPSGFSQGVFSSLGEYEQCLSIESPAHITPTIYGQYCLSSVVIPYPPMTGGLDIGPFDDLVKEIVIKTNLSRDHLVGGYMSKIIDALNLLKGRMFRSGMCLPSSCKPQDVEHAINEITFPYLRVPIEVSEHCDTKHSRPVLNIYQVVSLSVFSIILMLMVFGTCVELFPKILALKTRAQIYRLIPCNKSIASTIGKILVCFSVIENNRKLFAPARDLSAVEGMRVIASVVIAFAHQYILPVMSFLVFEHMLAPYGVMRTFLKSWRHLLLRNFNLSDIFFFLGGLMSGYILLTKLEQSSGKFNYFQIIAFRWLRILGPMIGMILIFFVLPLAGYGPIWNDVMEVMLVACHKYWYKNLLFTNNFHFKIPVDEYICNPVAWYSACDFQLFLLAPILVWLLYRYEHYGLLINLSVVLIGCFGSAAPRLVYGLPLYFEWTKWRSVDETLSTIKHTLYAPYAHLNSMTIGIITGYLIKRHRKARFRLSKLQLRILWIVLPSLTVGSILWLKDFFERDSISDCEAVLWAFISRVMFISGIAWICFACATGYGGFVNKFLSWHVFTPLSRLTIGVFLLHPIPMIYRYFTYQQHYEVTDNNMLTYSTFDYIMTIILAYILFLMFDCPTANLTQLLLKKSRSKINIVREN